MGCDLDDVRIIATTLPGTVAGPDDTSFAVAERGFVWIYPERIDPNKPRVPNPEVVVIMVEDLAEKEALLASDPVVFFTTDHYTGHRSVLVRLPAIDRSQLTELITDAHACTAALPPKRPRRKAGHPGQPPAGTTS